jgi:hypothetical protein
MRSIDLKDKTTLGLVQELHDYTARLEAARPGAQEKQE